MSHPYREPARRPITNTEYVRLKSRMPWSLVLGVLLLCVSVLSSCRLFTPKNVQTALDVAEVICIIANAESDDQTVKTICNIIDEKSDAFRAVLVEQRKASRQFAAAKSQTPTDAGGD